MTQAIINPGFEIGAGLLAPPWTLSDNGNGDATKVGRSAAKANSGGFSYYMISNDFSSGPELTVSQTNLALVPGAVYTFTFYLFPKTDVNCFVLPDLNGVALGPEVSDFTNGAWTMYTSQVTSPTSSTGTYTLDMAFQCFNGDNVHGVYMDDVTLTLNT